MNSNSPCGKQYAAYFIFWLLLLAGLMALNVWSQPYEDSISMVMPTTAYYLDYVWYLDDVIGPSFFLLSGLVLLYKSKLRFSQWPVIGLALSLVAFGLGDTTDVHWVLTTSMKVAQEGISFSSWMSKVMVVIMFCYFIIQSYDYFERPAQKSIIFAFTLLYIDQIQMSISLDFAGYSFHVFEESLEVITAAFFCIGVLFHVLKVDKKTAIQG